MADRQGRRAPGRRGGGSRLTTPSTGPSPRVTARVAGVFYLLTIVTGSLALVSSRVAAAATAVNEARWKEQAHAATGPAPGSRMR